MIYAFRLLRSSARFVRGAAELVLPLGVHGSRGLYGLRRRAICKVCVLPNGQTVTPFDLGLRKTLKSDGLPVLLRLVRGTSHQVWLGSCFWGR